MRRVWRKLRSDAAAGFVLPATVVFIFIVMIATLGFSSMVTYETKGALYRQSSVEAFYLADGAVERARAHLLTDGTWRGSMLGVAEGNGTYDVVVTDTTVAAGPVVKIIGTGHVGLADRRIEVWVQVAPSAFSYALFVGGDARISGNLCLQGEALVAGNAYGSSFAEAPHINCGGTYQEYVSETPPPAYTVANMYPGATYYSVRGVSRSPARAQIYNRQGVPVGGPTNLGGAVIYDDDDDDFYFNFNSNARIAQFDPVTGIFPLVAPDTCVVVNFGEAPTVNPPGPNGVARLNFTGTPVAGTPPRISTTIINSRFVGTTPAQRMNSTYWRGGQVSLMRCWLEPTNGLAMICNTLNCSTANGVQLGTSTRPALTYVTGSVTGFGSNLQVTGCLIALGAFRCTGGAGIAHNDDFFTRLPSFLQSGGSGGSGSLHVVRWRETAAPA